MLNEMIDLLKQNNALRKVASILETFLKQLMVCWHHFIRQL
jgi:hypothetical protein